MKTIGLIQARMGSRRLPGKVMLPLAGQPLVWHILDRLQHVPQIEDVVLATTTATENDILVQWARGEGVSVIRHPLEDDIAGRLTMAVEETGADLVVKINSDCPLVDPAVIVTALDLIGNNSQAGGVTNKLFPTYPLGLSVEILSRSTIKWCDRHLGSASDREMMVSWVFNHSEKFGIISLEQADDDHRYNLCVDTADDYAFVSGIFDALHTGGHCFGWNELKEYLAAQPSLPPCAFLDNAVIA